VSVLRAHVVVALCLCAGSITGCGGGGAESWSFGWFGSEHDRRYAGHGPMRVQWSERLTEEHEGPYLPVERAVAQLDPASDRVYVGSTAGFLYAMGPAGGRVYRYDAGGAIESQPALDTERDELYFGTEQGDVHALRASDGQLRWRDNVGGPIRQAPVLSEDAVYVVTDSDVVAAFAREDGAPLWSYSREAPEGFSITEHAGLVLAEGNVLTGFTDGVVVALDATDGRIVWERDTAVEVDTEDSAAPRFVDVDTTPVVVAGEVYVASFAGGVYALDRTSGTVLWHDSSLTGVTAIEATAEYLVMSSADEGVVALGLDDREVRWRHPIERGSPSAPTITGDQVLVGASNGPFLALALDSGQEQGRFEAGHGFSAPAAARGGLGFVVSNGGSLFAFSY